MKSSSGVRPALTDARAMVALYRAFDYNI